INRFAIPDILETNNMDSDVAEPPYFEFGEIEVKDLGALGTYLKTLTDIGAVSFPDQALEEHLRRIGELPPAPEEPVVPEDYVYTVRQPLQSEIPQAPPQGNFPDQTQKQSHDIYDYIDTGKKPPPDFYHDAAPGGRKQPGTMRRPPHPGSEEGH